MKESSYDEDVRLIHAIQDDELGEEAFEALYRKYYKLVLFIANRECTNESDAQDVLQETFIEIRKSIKHLKKPKYFRLWLYRVVNSKCKDLFRSRKFSLVDSDNDYIRNNIREEHREAIPDMQMKFSSDRDVMMSLIDELPQRQRIVLMMYYLEQCSIKEIAQVLEIPEGTVKSRISTAKTSLKEKIEKYEQQEQVKLSFYSIDVLLAQALLIGAQKACGKALPFPKKLSWKMRPYSHLAQGLLISSCLVTVVCGVFYSLQDYEDSLQGHSFQAVHYEDRILSTSTEAYFYLLSKACCEDEINRMSIEDLNGIQAAYQSIKEENSYHYQLLKDMGWVKAYEARINEQ